MSSDVEDEILMWRMGPVLEKKYLTCTWLSPALSSQQ